MRVILLAAFAIIVASARPGYASEVVLYDNANCAGPSRTLITSEQDLARVEFGNDAASVQVIAGTWTFYRDPFFQSNNGPPFTLGPGACVDMGTGPAAQFPPDLMDSVQLVQAAPGPEAAIALFDGINLQPPYRVLTGDALDLNAVEFNDRADSFRVLSGSWLIFQEILFGGAPTEAIGVANDVQALGIPRNAASSVQRVVLPSPAPPQLVTVDCPRGAAANATGTACVDCAANGLVLAPDARACLCPPGQTSVGSRQIDGVTVAICQPEVAEVRPPPVSTRPPLETTDLACTGNEVFVGTLEAGGGCLPCPEETEPDPSHAFCRCIDGYVQTGIGRGGFPICNPPSAAVRPERIETVAPAGEFFRILRDRGFPIAVSSPIAALCHALILGGQLVFEHGQTVPNALGGISFCDIRLFHGARLNEGWRFAGFGPMVPSCSWPDWRGPLFTVDRLPGDPADLSHTIRVFAEFPLNNLCQVTVSTVTLIGPSPRWKEAVLGPPWEGPIDLDPL